MTLLSHRTTPVVLATALIAVGAIADRAWAQRQGPMCQTQILGCATSGCVMTGGNCPNGTAFFGETQVGILFTPCGPGPTMNCPANNQVPSCKSTGWSGDMDNPCDMPICDVQFTDAGC